MKLLIESAMIFFGTLLAAGLVALASSSAGTARRRSRATPRAGARVRRCTRRGPPADGRHEWHGSHRRAPAAIRSGSSCSRASWRWRSLLALLLAFFPWDSLRGPLNRYVSDRTGRHFEITRQLDVKLGRTTRILADGIEFANPDWARDPHLVKAEAAEIHIELLPLLERASSCRWSS